MPDLKLGCAITCAAPGCGLIFWVLKSVEDRWRMTHEDFSCPAGHRNHFAAKTAADVAEEKLAKMEDMRDTWRRCCWDAQDTARHERLSKAGLKGAMVRQLNDLRRQIGENGKATE